MKINYLNNTPRKVIDSDDLPEYMSANDVTDVVEIFNTPLTGSYNWDYTIPVSYTHLTLPTMELV